MPWDDIRSRARLSVHSHFGRDAVYVAPGSTRRIKVKVRVHTRIARFGDNDREGYADVVEDINRIVFLQSEVTPTRGGEVTVSGSVYKIEMITPADDTTVVACDVIRKGPVA